MMNIWGRCCRISAGWDGEEVSRHYSNPVVVIKVNDHRPIAAIITLIWGHMYLLVGTHNFEHLLNGLLYHKDYL